MAHTVQSIDYPEGGATLSVPKQSFSDPHHCEVFFNPAMRFSRTMGSLCVGVLKPASVLDGLSATGARGVRYAAENKGVKKLFLVDANPLALGFAGKNLKLNKLSSKGKAVYDHFEDFCIAHRGEFDFVEVDPFGTPAPFIESALDALKSKGGVLSITATDLANLVKKNAPTLRDYGAKPLYNDFSHETSLRILLGFIARKAWERKLCVTPLLCYYELHYVKLVVEIEKGKRKPVLGFISYCDKCLSRFVGMRKKCVCGNRLLYAGPLWLGDFCDKKFLKKLIELNGERNYEDRKRIEKTLWLLTGEQGFPPWFFGTHSVSDEFGLAVGKMSLLMEGLGKKFKVARTHFSPNGLKTTAPAKKFVETARASWG
ncbi:TPA: hypothetical protein HA244_00760 [Candidatus Micrarchaeota archaeon]|nr:hypothetical protein [Candidatus Micrarchaeota archaeon]